MVMIGINMTNMATTLVTTGPSRLFLQSYTSPFTYEMPTWTPTAPGNVVSQPVIPSILVVLVIPFNPFNPASFGMSHIPLSAPSLESGYMPSTNHPIHNVSD